MVCQQCSQIRMCSNLVASMPQQLHSFPPYPSPHVPSATTLLWLGKDTVQVRPGMPPGFVGAHGEVDGRPLARVAEGRLRVAEELAAAEAAGPEDVKELWGRSVNKSQCWTIIKPGGRKWKSTSPPALPTHSGTCQSTLPAPDAYAHARTRTTVPRA